MIRTLLGRTLLVLAILLGVVACGDSEPQPPEEDGWFVVDTGKGELRFRRTGEVVPPGAEGIILAVAFDATDKAARAMGASVEAAFAKLDEGRAEYKRGEVEVAEARLREAREILRVAATRHLEGGELEEAGR